MTGEPSNSISTVGPSTAVGLESSPRTVAIHTHGCKLNQADSQGLSRQFQEAGYRLVGPSDLADVVVLNTCTVTATADAKARQFLRAARRRIPGAVVVATGCYAQRAPADLEGLAPVSLVVGNRDKARLVESVQNAMEESGQISSQNQEPLPLVTGLPNPSLPPEGGASGGFPPPEREGPSQPTRTRAMVKIQEGCNQVCAYCIVPKVRGLERSIPPDLIVAEINRHVADGYREVALTGTQLGTYGFDLPGDNLTRLLERILSETSVERLRVSSLQAHEITSALLELWQDRRLMPHFHIPLQSGCDATLKAMRRRYDTGRFADAVSLARGMYPNVGITTDIIAGFPGETAKDFAASLTFAAAMRFSDIHAFPYSTRPGTSAAYFGEQVAEPEKRARMGEMLALATDSRRAFRQQQLGSVRQVLWERRATGWHWSGLTDNYLRVRATCDIPLSNRITRARLSELQDDWVLAEVAPG